MLPIITRHWWALVLRGVVALVFGGLALAYPPITFDILAIFVSAYLVIDGVFAIVAGIRAAERHRRWWPFALEGLLDLAAGVIVFMAPGVLLGLLAFWAIVTGLLLIVPAFGVPGAAGRWLLVLNGMLSLLLGVVILVQPLTGVLFVAVSVGLYALLFGIGLIALGLHVRKLQASHIDIVV